MGQKYKILKSRLEEVRERGLLLIDDTEIRRQAFEKTEKILKKIDGLERKIEDFETTDQKRFREWFDLTFRGLKGRIEDIRNQVIQTSRLHNSMVAHSRMNKVDMIDAYAAIKQEELDWAQGDAQVRERIDQLRAARDAFIERECRRDYGYDTEVDNDDRDESESARDLNSEDGDRENGDRDDNERENGFDDQPDLSSLSAKQVKQYNYYKTLTDEKLKNLFGERGEESEFLAMEVLHLAIQTEDFNLLSRVWAVTNAQTKKSLNSMAKKNRMPSIDDLLTAHAQFQNDWQEGEDPSFDEEDEAESRHSNSGAFRGRGSESTRTLNPAQQLEIKSLYHRLVRQLHPDMQTEQRSSWMSAMWHEVQKRYQGLNLDGLKQIELNLIFRRRELHRLTLSEIHQSEAVAQGQLDQLNRKTSLMKRNPAWGFSKRKDFAPLIRRARVELDDELRFLQVELNELRYVHGDLETAHQSRLRRNAKRAAKPKAKLKRKNNQRDAERPFGQQEMGF